MRRGNSRFEFRALHSPFPHRVVREKQLKNSSLEEWGPLLLVRVPCP